MPDRKCLCWWGYFSLRLIYKYSLLLSRRKILQLNFPVWKPQNCPCPPFPKFFAQAFSSVRRIRSEKLAIPTSSFRLPISYKIYFHSQPTNCNSFCGFFAVPINLKVGGLIGWARLQKKFIVETSKKNYIYCVVSYS